MAESRRSSSGWRAGLHLSPAASSPNPLLYTPLDIINILYISHDIFLICVFICSFAEDPWSVPELYLESLEIEVIVHGRRPGQSDGRAIGGSGSVSNAEAGDAKNDSKLHTDDKMNQGSSEICQESRQDSSQALLEKKVDCPELDVAQQVTRNTKKVKSSQISKEEIPENTRLKQSVNIGSTSRASLEETITSLLSKSHLDKNLERDNHDQVEQSVDDSYATKKEMNVDKNTKEDISLNQGNLEIPTIEDSTLNRSLIVKVRRKQDGQERRVEEVSDKLFNAVRADDSSNIELNNNSAEEGAAPSSGSTNDLLHVLENFVRDCNLPATQKLESSNFEVATQEEELRVYSDHIEDPGHPIGQGNDPGLTSSTSQSSLEVSPEYLILSPLSNDVRWVSCTEEETSENTSTKENLRESTSKSSSQYFSNLLKDVNFDDNFFQCPVKEKPEQTFQEHLSGPFFGETGSTSPPLSEPLNLQPQRQCIAGNLSNDIDPQKKNDLTVTMIMPPPPSSDVSNPRNLLEIKDSLLTKTNPEKSKKRKRSRRRNKDNGDSSSNELINPKDPKKRKLSVTLGNPKSVHSSVIQPNKNANLFQTMNGTNVTVSKLNMLQLADNTLGIDSMSSKEICRKIKRSGSCLDTNISKLEKDQSLGSAEKELPCVAAETSTKMSSVPCDKDDQCISEEEIPRITLDSDEEFQIIMPKKRHKPNHAIEEYKEKNTYDGDIQLNYEGDKMDINMQNSQEFENENGMLDLKVFKVAQNKSSINANNLMCGITDSSVPHDKNCFSPNAKEFEDFEQIKRIEKADKVYRSKRALDFEPIKKQVDLIREQISISETLPVDICVPDTNPFGVSHSEIFTDYPGFGSTKFSPQLESNDGSDQDSTRLLEEHVAPSGFMAYMNSSESSVPASDSDSESCMSFSVKKDITEKILKHKISDIKTDPEISDSETSVNDCRNSNNEETSSFDESENDSDIENNDNCEEENLEGVQNPRLTSKPAMIHLVDSLGRVLRKIPIGSHTQSHGKHTNITISSNQAQENANVFLSKNVLTNQPVIPVVPLSDTAKLNYQQNSGLLKTPFNSTSHFSQPGSTSGANLVYNCTAGPQGPQTFSSKSSHHILNSGPVQPINVKLPSTICHQTRNWFQASPATQDINSTNRYPRNSSCQFGRMPPPIDYRMPLKAKPPIIIPPALASSYKEEHKVYAVTSQTPSGSVTRLLRLNTTPSQTQGPSTQTPGPSTQTPGPSTQTPGPSTQTPGPSTQTLGPQQGKEKTEGEMREQSSSNMLKKVKMGSKGGFYIRPTPTMMDAIAELRKKKEFENNEKERKSGFIELPDGTPIAHPISIPQKTLPLRIKKKKKKRKPKVDDQFKSFVKQKLRETMERSKDEEVVPEMVAVLIGGKLHFCQRNGNMIM